MNQFKKFILLEDVNAQGFPILKSEGIIDWGTVFSETHPISVSGNDYERMELSELWDMCLEEIVSKTKLTKTFLDSLGEAFFIEIKEFGTSIRLNPFINFLVNNRPSESISNIWPGIHNCFVYNYIKKIDLTSPSIISELLLNKEFHKFSNLAVVECIKIIDGFRNTNISKLKLNGDWAKLSSIKDVIKNIFTHRVGDPIKNIPESLTTLDILTNTREIIENKNNCLTDADKQVNIKIAAKSDFDTIISKAKKILQIADDDYSMEQLKNIVIDYFKIKLGDTTLKTTDNKNLSGKILKLAQSKEFTNFTKKFSANQIISDFNK